MDQIVKLVYEGNNPGYNYYESQERTKVVIGRIKQRDNERQMYWQNNPRE